MSREVVESTQFDGKDDGLAGGRDVGCERKESRPGPSVQLGPWENGGGKR